MIYFVLLFLIGWIDAVEPLAVYATIDEKPETQIILCWILEEPKDSDELKYHLVGSDQWYTASAQGVKVGEKLPYSFFAVHLAELNPGGRYEFVLDGSRHFFQTLPKDPSKPIRFVVGGDVYHDNLGIVEGMNRIASAQNPDFALIGGDVAYAGSKFSFLGEDSKRWIDFLALYSKSLVRSDGNMIPVISAIGNHDVNGRYGETPAEARLFYLFFPSQDPSYRVIDFATFSLFVLDSGHTYPIEGLQKRWLSSALQQREKVPYKFALYHVPAYPCVRSFTNRKCTAVRENWVPLFEQFSLTAAFEHHDHAYKRSQLIKEGKVDPKGVLYLGDGAWGVESPRKPNSPSELWYLAKSGAFRHIILVTVKESQVTFEAINSEGKVFDSVSR